jgi:hypothetical protein
MTTTEGRPDFQHDWVQEYAKQRKCRMQDAIDDYLQDERVTARQAYEEMLSCVDDVINYHRENMDRAVALRSLMMGNREVDLDSYRVPERY